jgi:5-oxopent-3-ene-1,2,5-tricarboxylate decarboxylase / 2-hydroxyhepta-2,4-diene-1,7-dioate isomerase
MSFFPTRTVVGAMFEFQSAWLAAEPSMLQPPHHRPPAHPVLYIKPANTWRRAGDTVWLPEALPGEAAEHAVAEIEVGATLGISFARAAARVSAAQALSYVSGYCVVNDVTVPHRALLRPPMRQKCRDSFCPIGPWVPAAQVADPGQLTIRAYVNGELRQTGSTRELRRSVAQLIADVSEFMSLAPGDLLLVGVPHGAPSVKAGDTMAVEIDGIGRLENPVRREGDIANGSGAHGSGPALSLTKQVSA